MFFPGPSSAAAAAAVLIVPVAGAPRPLPVVGQGRLWGRVVDRQLLGEIECCLSVDMFCWVHPAVMTWSAFSRE